MASETDGSVTPWIGAIGQGDQGAARPLSGRDFARLFRLVRGRELPGAYRPGDRARARVRPAGGGEATGIDPLAPGGVS